MAKWCSLNYLLPFYAYLAESLFWYWSVLFAPSVHRLLHKMQNLTKVIYLNLYEFQLTPFFIHLIYLLAFFGVFFEVRFAFVSVHCGGWAAKNLPNGTNHHFRIFCHLQCRPIFFYLGRKKGPIGLTKISTSSQRVAKSREFIAKEKNVIILLTFRYLYGFRS